MNFSYTLAWYFFGTVYRLVFRARFYGAANVPRQGPVVLAANHASFMDPTLAAAGLRRQVNFLARDTLFKNWLAGPLMRSWEVVPVDRDGGGGAGLKAILSRLQHREAAILLFPEGTRTPDGRLQPAHSGIGLTVIKSACPVVPVRLFGTFEAFGRHMKLPRPHGVVVKYGRPIDFGRWRAEARTCGKARLKEIYQQVADELMAAIAQLPPCEELTTFPRRD